jgi:hypothetical protein
MEVPRALSQRVVAYQGYMAAVHHDSLAKAAFAGLSENLVKELRLCTYRKLVLQAPFLHDQSKDVICRVVDMLKDTVYLPADFIVRHGDQGRELFFMCRGEAAVFVGSEAPIWGLDDEVASYTAGNYFGELGMLTGKPRAAWIMAKNYVVCSVLHSRDVDTLDMVFPGAFTTLVQSMVRGYKLKPKISWKDISLPVSGLEVETIEDAFEWFCDLGSKRSLNELDCKGFDMGLRKLRVAELDRKIFWAELDESNNGAVTLEQFASKVQLSHPEPGSRSLNRHAFRALPARSERLRGARVSQDHRHCEDHLQGRDLP